MSRQLSFAKPSPRLKSIPPAMQRYAFELEQQNLARGNSGCWDRGRKSSRAQKVARLAQEKAEFHQH